MGKALLLSDRFYWVASWHTTSSVFVCKVGVHELDLVLKRVCVFALTGADGSSAGGQPAGRQHYAEDGSTLLICTLAPLQWQVCSPLPARLYVMHVVCFALFTHMCLSFPQFVPVQTPVRRGAVRPGREADAQTEQERQVGVGGGSDTAEKSHDKVMLPRERGKKSNL